MDNPNLGQIIEGEKQKDAVHIAIAPVAAAERLSPGQDVGFIGESVGTCKEPIGIVDPFLKGPVFKGERFWLFLYPGTITSLRHDWTHPAFSSESENVSDSAAWLRSFAIEAGISYKELLEAAGRYLKTGEYLDEGPKFSGISAGDEFWDHYEDVTSTIVPDRERGSFFSCSC